MFDAPTELTIDELEHHLLDCVAAISKVTGQMLPAIRALDAGQVAHLDGARSMDEWLAARLDLDVRTARRLLGLARANDHRVEQMLEDGQSTDRADAMLSLIQAGADSDTLDAAAGHDIAGVRRMAAGRRRLNSSDEADCFESRFFHMQPSLDESVWKLWGQLAGADGRILEKAVHTAVDSFPNNPHTTAGQDRADGLVAVASEWLSGEIGGHDLTAEIFIDGNLATVTDGETGPAWSAAHGSDRTPCMRSSVPAPSVSTSRTSSGRSRPHQPVGRFRVRSATGCCTVTGIGV